MKAQLLKLEEVQNHFDHWRKTRTKRSRIPEHFWQWAVHLTNNHRITHVAVALRLNCNDLKARVKAIQSNTKLATQKQVTFVQLQEQQHTINVSSNDMPVEFKRPDGITMRIQIPHCFFPTLFETFVGGQGCYK